MRNCVTCGTGETLEAPFIEGQCERCIRGGQLARQTAPPQFPPPKPKPDNASSPGWDWRKLLTMDLNPFAPKGPQPALPGVQRTAFDARDLLIVAGFLVAQLIAAMIVVATTMTEGGLAMPGLLAIVFINAMTGGLLAQTIRGRFVAGMVVAGVLGCIGNFVILLFVDHRRKCPHCLSTIVPQATVCARCGRETTVA